MTTVQITLPDQLAQEAQRAGLLSPQSLEKWLREQLKAQHVDQLFSAMDRMSAIDEPAIMSPEAVAEEIAAMRAEMCLPIFSPTSQRPTIYPRRTLPIRAWPFAHGYRDNTPSGK
ncbi:MAG: hypothetical protein ABSH09_25380 [Bryobacteraceae bacterium]|jgi:hypothetical protein